MSLNIAVIGCGMIGREHIERIQNRIKDAKVVAVCDVFEEGAKKGAAIAGEGTKVYTDFHAAINDPDVNAVVVTTMTNRHPNYRPALPRSFPGFPCSLQQLHPQSACCGHQ